MTARGLPLVLMAVALGACARAALVPPGPTPARTPLATAADFADLPVGRSVARRGQVAYAQLCVSCHGWEGHGDGPAADLLRRAPRNFRDVDYGRRQRPDWYRRAVARGVPGTAMSGWDHRLDTATTWDVAYFVWSWSITPAQLGRGRAVYAQRCQSCHGADGRAEPAARLDAAVRARLSLAESFAEMSEAHPTLLGGLTPADRDALAAHVATFLYEPVTP